ncbi:hypothetical protein ACFL1X_14180 [Candidatus Hydrogenedentota bacterium]
MKKLILALVMLKLLFLTWDEGVSKTAQLFTQTYNILFLEEPKVAALEGPRGELQK